MRNVFARLYPRGACLAAIVLAAAACAFWLAMHDPATPELPSDRLVLVVPDGSAADDVHLHVWKDAAAELGLRIDVVQASELMRPGGLAHDAAIILPDAIHREMNDTFIAHLHDRVEAGGRLMLVHDAGTLGMNGGYAHESRMSALAGVSYALHGELGTALWQQTTARVNADDAEPLGFPPGKLVDGSPEATMEEVPPNPHEANAWTVAGYHYGPLRYTSFVTRGPFLGHRLMHGDDGSLLAGVQAYGAGKVLFVNLPLTTLKLRTDGLPLHLFLRYFAIEVAQMAQLSPTPGARGVLVMNWHIDSGAAVHAMDRLASLGALQQGPYSIHLTAGPDLDHFGDGAGMDLPHNERMRQWVARLAQRGDQLGSHGGWIHNHFGLSVGRESPAWSQDLILRNAAAVSQASGQPVREYSSPNGNHPAWMTPWLHARGIRAYYFTGDIGMPPTRSYQGGRRPATDMWAFPVLTHGEHAAFEEAHAAGVAEVDIADWLISVADFCAEQSTARLVYFHPPGILLYPKAFRRWLDHTGRLIGDGRLQWMTMAGYAEFSDRRLSVQWSVSGKRGVAGSWTLRASHENSLRDMSWLLPANRFLQPFVLEGSARVERAGARWRITAMDTRHLVVSLMPAVRTSQDPLFVHQRH